MPPSASFLTLTLNPALDVFTRAPQVQPTHKTRCAAALEHPGGGGVNVARVLTRLGASAVALLPAGGVTGQRVRELLVAEGVAATAIPIAGETRQSFSVRDDSNGAEYRFVLPGPSLTAAEWEACLLALATAVDDEGHPHWVVLSGSLPPQAPGDMMSRVAHCVRDMGASLVVDTSGPALAQALQAGVRLIKPSLRELAELTGRPLDTPAQQWAAARRLIDAGCTEWVALSRGDQGALLVNGQGAWEAQAPAVQVQSTIGAGDSFLAGLLWALDQDQPPEVALAQAVATGAAAVRQSGTGLTNAAEVAELLSQVHVQALA